MHRIYILLFFTLPSAYGSALKHEFIEINSQIKLEKYHSVKAGEYDSAETVVFKSSDDSIIKIRKTDLKGKSEKDMTKFFTKNIIQYSLLFQDRASPYAGAVTVNTECVDKVSTRHKVITTKESLITSFETMATENLIYGKCDGEKRGYYSRYFLVLCKEKTTFYDVKFFSRNKNDLKDLEIKCVK